MLPNVSIRILAEDNNRRGDLFGRLMSDLFLSLGYDNVRLNIARSGREIDIEAEHRLEKRRAIAECKALEGRVGGAEINAFAGKLRPERRRRSPGSLTPYFISLSGFTETSVDQEAESGDDAVILVDGSRVVSELIKGRILVPLERATEQAGRYVASAPELALDDEAELLAHDRGWVWAVYYTQGKERTHVVLVHSDGTPLAAAVASRVIEADLQVGGMLHRLTCLNPESLGTPDAKPQVTVALRRYYEYLSAECGHILLDGLPADAEVGTLRLRLENLFVPLHLIDASNGDQSPPVESDLPTRIRRRIRRHPVGEILTAHHRLAVLASPGGGKSTLLKRLAVAYADPTRRALADDNLPDRSWLPLFFRCRELRERARAPFPELLDALAVRAFIGEHTAAFRVHIDHALRDGDVLLLIDGLDEIADAGDRAAFVRNLRTFLAVYPAVSLVVTSREAGFRHVAGLLATACLQTRLADFSTQDILRLTVAWHREVIGNRPGVIADATRLARTISKNDRIRRLAANPLLLTTLLLVKRWVGQLPTRRSVLYGKAVEVLLMTWNVEAHEPIEQDEALPQLCYVAFAMMQHGVQKISRRLLNDLLVQAREQLSAELAFARIGVREFVERIEHRSSLLMMTGLDVVDGTLMEFYEFRHLTFQEYLAAKAIVEGWYPNRNDGDTLVSLLKPHFKDEKWREVVPLAAVLAGRKADALIKELAHDAENRIVFTTLGICLADEVQATPDTIRIALQVLVANPQFLVSMHFTGVLARGKYGSLLRESVGRVFLTQVGKWVYSGPLLGDVVASQILDDSTERQEAFIGEMECLLASTDRQKRCEGALAARYISPSLTGAVDTLAIALVPLLESEHPSEQIAACWALIHIGKRRPRGFPANGLRRLFELWQESTHAEIRMFAASALNRLPLLPRDVEPLRESPAIKKFLSDAARLIEHRSRENRVSALVAGYYLRSPWNDEDLARATITLLNEPNPPWRGKLRELLAAVKPPNHFGPPETDRLTSE